MESGKKAKVYKNLPTQELPGQVNNPRNAHQANGPPGTLSLSG